MVTDRDRQKNSGYIDINTLLQVLNAIIMIGAIFSSGDLTENRYINQHVINLSCLIHLQIYVLLRYEKKNTNPFILLLCLNVLVFYLLRIYTLLIDLSGFSISFRRVGAENIGPDQLADFLVYLHLSVWAIFIGFASKDMPALLKSRILSQQPDFGKAYQAYTIFAFLALMTLFVQSWLRDPDLTNFNPGLIFGLFAEIFNYDKVISLLIILIFLDRKVLDSDRRKFPIVILVIMLALLIIPGGGSSPLYRFGLPILFAFLVLYGRLKIRKMIIPIVLILGVVFSIYGTYMKFNKMINKSGESRNVVSAMNSISGDEFGFIFSNIYARAGFLDFSVEIMNNKEYERLINLRKYYEAVVDAVLTPGFDVYDTPLAANAMQSIYRSDWVTENPKRSELFGEKYQSDQINVFAEYYVLFGSIISLPLLTLSALGFRKIYQYFADKFSDPIFNKLIGTTILSIYYSWLKSFGLDWMMVDLKTILLFLFVIYTFVWLSMHVRLRFASPPVKQVA